jgi:hypothetical protein
MGKLVPFAHLLARRFLKDTAGMSWASRMRILDVLQKANRLRLARLEAASAIVYPLPEEQINPPLDPDDPWHTGPVEVSYAVDEIPNPPQ